MRTIRRDNDLIPLLKIKFGVVSAGLSASKKYLFIFHVVRRDMYLSVWILENLTLCWIFEIIHTSPEVDKPHGSTSDISVNT
jgi:hypothetical protein